MKHSHERGERLSVDGRDSLEGRCLPLPSSLSLSYSNPLISPSGSFRVSTSLLVSLSINVSLVVFPDSEENSLWITRLEDSDSRVVQGILQ